MDTETTLSIVSCITFGRKENRGVFYWDKSEMHIKPNIPAKIPKQSSSPPLNLQGFSAHVCSPDYERGVHADMQHFIRPLQAGHQMRVMLQGGLALPKYLPVDPYWHSDFPFGEMSGTCLGVMLSMENNAH